MVRLFACILTVLGLSFSITALADSNDDLRLYRAVHWKAVDASDSQYEVFKGREFFQRIPAGLIGIDTIWWHDQGPAMNSLFMHDIRLEEGKRMVVTLDHQKNDFPMDARWDVLWSKSYVFELNKTFTYFSRIKDRDFRITIVLKKKAG